MKSINEIKSKLEKLRTLDKEFEIFGASGHQYKFNEPFSIDKLIEFEEKYKVSLPEDYRMFLSEIGNGGAGPYYGIHPLQKHLGKFNPENEFELLKLKFPHTKAWNWSDKVFAKFRELQETEDDELAEFFNNVYWERYCRDELTHGSIYIAEYGCALRFLLVIAGDERGKIWFDQRADQKGLNPVTNEKGDKLDFSDWYVEWLDKSTQKISK